MPRPRRPRRKRGIHEKKVRRSSFLPSVAAFLIVVGAATWRIDETRRPVEALASSGDECEDCSVVSLGRVCHDSSCGVVVREESLRRLGEASTAMDATNGVVPDECRLVMAPSTVPNGGWGVFTTVSRKRGERASERGDALVHLTDPHPLYAHGMRRLVWEYLWDGAHTQGHYEGRYVLSALPGMGMLANGLRHGGNLMLGGREDEEGDGRCMTVDNAGLRRGVEPGAGAISHYHDVAWSFTRDVGVGEELFVEYGEGWFRERGFDVNDDEELAKSSSRRRRSVQELKKEGYCLDNLVPGPSLLRGAGRGAFASRNIPRGQIIAPMPVIPLSSLSLEMMRAREDGSIFASSQLFKNYCFGHPDSSLLFFPYSHGVNYINHDGTAANAELRWWSGSMDYFNKTLLELQQLPSVQLMLELVATRPIDEGDEVYLDYGPDWVEAWENHVRDWHDGQHRKHEPHSFTSEDMNNNDTYRVIRTLEEQQSQPYPKDVFTSCYYRYFGQKHLLKERVAWKHTEGIKSSQNLRPCLVVGKKPFATGRDGNSRSTHTYTVRIMNRPGLKDTERVPKGHELVVTNVPRHALVFSDKTYSSDQHLESAFRKEMSLGDLFPDSWKDRWDGKD